MFLTKSTKSPFYQLVYELNGKRTTVSTKTKSKSEAMKFMRNFKVEDRPVERIQRVTLQVFKNEYMAYCRENKSKHYVKGSIKTTFTMLEKALGNPLLNDISVRAVDKFISAKYKTAPYSAVLTYRVIKAAMNKAIQWGYLKENPLRNLKCPRVPRKLPLFISQEELNSIISNIEDSRIKRMCEFAFYTGMRLSEMTNLTWECVNLHNRIITIKNNGSFTTKNKTDRIVPICSKVQDILLFETEWNKKYHSTYVFNKVPKVKYNEDYVSKKFKSAVKNTTVNPDVHFHTIRHSFASMLVSKGVSLYVVKELLGHSDFATTQIYAHLQKDALQEAVKVLD